MRGSWNWWQAFIAFCIVWLLLPGAALAKPKTAPVRSAPAKNSIEQESSADFSRATSLRNYLAVQPDGIGLDVIDGPSLNQILLALPKGQTESVSISFSPTPSRLTVNIPDWKGKKELKVSSINTSFVSGLKITPQRVGASMLVSLSSGRKLEYQTDRGVSKPSSDLLVISIAPTGKLKTLLASLPDGYRKPVIGHSSEMRASLSPKETEISTIEATEPEAAAVQAAALVSSRESEQLPPARGENIVNSLKTPVFSSGENAVVIATASEISQAPELQALGNSIYSLRFKNARLSQTAALTSLFPAGSGTLGSVRSTQQGNDAVLKIFCSEETPLKLRYSGKAVIVGTDSVVASYNFKN